MSSGPVLVTGGTGFIGTAVVNALVARGHEIRMLTRRSVSSDRSAVTISTGDVTSLSDVHRAVRGCAGVVHCAAEKRDAQRMPAVNVTATRHLFDASRQAGAAFFCHLSSVGTIGLTDRHVVDESTPCRPMNPYEQTKRKAELIVAEGLPDGRVIILRPTNVFGAETVPAFLDGSVSSRVRLFLKGRESAHLVYVKDVAAAAAHLIELSSDERVATYIISSDEEAGTTHRDVQAYVSARLETAARAPLVAAPLVLPYAMRRLRTRAANRGDVVYSAGKLFATGFRFPFGLRKGLDDAIAEFRRRSSRRQAT